MSIEENVYVPSSDHVWNALLLALEECGGPTEVRLALVSRAYELEPSSEVTYGDTAQVYGVNFARHNYSADAALCLACANDPRPHHGCYGWLCCCPCNGEEV